MQILHMNSSLSTGSFRQYLTICAQVIYSLLFGSYLLAEHLFLSHFSSVTFEVTDRAGLQRLITPCLQLWTGLFKEGSDELLQLFVPSGPPHQSSQHQSSLFSLSQGQSLSQGKYRCLLPAATKRCGPLRLRPLLPSLHLPLPTSGCGCGL